MRNINTISYLSSYSMCSRNNCVGKRRSPSKTSDVADVRVSIFSIRSDYLHHKSKAVTNCGQSWKERPLCGELSKNPIDDQAWVVLASDQSNTSPDYFWTSGVQHLLLPWLFRGQSMFLVVYGRRVYLNRVLHLLGRVMQHDSIETAQFGGYFALCSRQHDCFAVTEIQSVNAVSQ